jgi:sigma-B regulation protein RsbU (phosphoserine phosphatase)
LITQNFFIGGMPDTFYKSAAISLPEGPARLYIFSDGAYEVDRPGGAMWTLEELRDHLLADSPDESSQIEGLYRFLQEMRGQATLDDDFSMLKVSFSE